MIETEPVWWLRAIGTIAAAIFYGRFYVQWIASERAGRSVMPVAFWYMSSVGSLMLLGFGAATGSANGTLSHSFNIVVYTRNLIHIWREKGTLTPVRYRAVNVLVVCVALLAAAVLAYTWWNKYLDTQNESPEVAQKIWFWIAVGAVAQGLFASRFLVQWIASEAKKKSVIPVAFWYLSLAAGTLLCLAHLNQQEWIYAAGVASTVVIYLRNLWLIHRGTGDPAPPAG